MLNRKKHLSSCDVRPSGCQPSRLVGSDGKVQCLGSLSWARPTSQRVSRVLSYFNRSGATKCWYLSGFLVQRSDLGPLEFEGSHASTKALQQFSTDRASGAVSDCPRLHLAGERSTGPTPRQPQLGLADSRVLPIALFSRLSSASVGFPCRRGGTSSVGWVLLPVHTVPPA